MIQPLSQHVGLFQAGQMSQLGGSEKPGEAEHDGDGDMAKGAAATSATMSSTLPSHLGAKINTLA